MTSPGKDLIPMKALIEQGHVHWKSTRSVRRAIQNEKFPHYLVNNLYLFDLNEVRLWYKKREHKAS